LDAVIEPIQSGHQRAALAVKWFCRTMCGLDRPQVDSKVTITSYVFPLAQFVDEGLRCQRHRKPHHSERHELVKERIDMDTLSHEDISSPIHCQGRQNDCWGNQKN